MGETFIHTYSETTTGSVPTKKVLLKFEKLTGDEQYIDDDKTIEKLL